MLRFLVGAAAALALATAPVATAAEKFEVPADPFAGDMPDDYRNWASVLSQVLLKKEGSEDAAVSALGRVMLSAHGHLAKVANGEDLFPRLHLADPVFAADVADLPHELEALVGKVAGAVKGKLGGGHKVKATKFAASKTFANFAPCVLQETHTGVGASLTALNFAPSLLSFFPTGAAAAFQGVNIFPQLIWIDPIGARVQAQGLNVQPVLVYLGPIGLNVQPQGLNVQPIKINVSPVGKNIQPQGKVVAPAKLVYAPAKVLYNPRKGPVYAPVGQDLAALDVAGEFGQTEGGTSVVGDTATVP